MNPSLANFQQQSLKTRYDWFGNEPDQPLKLAGTEVKACMTSVRSRKQLGNGFSILADFIVRLRVSEHPDAPETDWEVEYKGKSYRVIEVRDHPISGEWCFTVGDLG